MLSVALAVLGSGCARSTPADLVVIGDTILEVADGKVRRARDPSSDDPIAIGPDTAMIRADRVTAGFVDAHGHPDGLASKLAELDLGGAHTYAETLDRVAMANMPDGWLLGSGWDQEAWSDAPEGGWPLAVDLEKVAPSRRILLHRVDGHAAWVSLPVLAEAGIVAATPDPPGGRIIRDKLGNPTGVLVDRAVDLVKVPRASPYEERRRIQAALVLIAAKGLTGVHMMGASDRWLKILEDLAREDRLPVRLWVFVDPDGAGAERLLRDGPYTVGRMRVIGIKLYADGALGSRGALLSAPYADAPESTGTEVTPQAEIERVATAALGAGVEVAVHAIGDLAVTHTLDAFAAARAAHPDRGDVPLRIEHAQVVRPEDRPRFAALGVTASMQPTHATSDAPWAEARLGPERITWAYAWRSLRQAGAPLAFGSDFPVESVDPALGLAAAVAPGSWHTAEAVGLDDAIAAFTTGAARAVSEAELGGIAVDGPADLTLWQVAGDEWRAIGTVVGGELVAGAPLPH